VFQFAPQPGPQTTFFSTKVDIGIFGGAAGGGKSWALIAEGARHRNNPRYKGVLFRRTSPEITNPGGLWDEAGLMYPLLGGSPNQSRLEYKFPSRAMVKFAHLQHEKHKQGWQGSQVVYQGWDELPHFTESQFWYLSSRQRSLSGIRGYTRGTCNPAPGWVRDLLAPWVIPGWEGDGFGPAASGEIRHFLRLDNRITWVRPGTLDSAGQPAKTLTFIRSSIYDNQILLKSDPAYLSTLLALPDIERKRLLEGDWNVFEGAFFGEWSEATHVESPLSELPAHWIPHGGIDWGFRAPFAAVLCATDETGCTRVIDCVKRAGLTNEAQAAQVKAMLAKWKVDPQRCLFSCDESMWARKTVNGVKMPPDIEAYIAEGLKCAPSKSERRHGWNMLRRWLHAPRRIDGKSVAFRVWAGMCSELIRLFPLMQFEKDGEDMDSSGDDHLHDALRYAIDSRPRYVPDPSAPIILGPEQPFDNRKLPFALQSTPLPSFEM
jgi:hypothetical protein